MSPTDLPQFLVTATHGESCRGRFDPSPFIGERWIGCIYLGDGRFIWGRFTRVDQIQHTCEFLLDDPTAAGLLRTGGSYPYLDGYWGERAELVLDAERAWRESDFQPTDAVRVPAPQGVWLTRSTDEAPIGGDLVPKGWDHEHCSICREKIGCGGQASGFVDEKDDWVCGECFRQYVAPRSLAFVTWQTGYVHPPGL